MKKLPKTRAEIEKNRKRKHAHRFNLNDEEEKLFQNRMKITGLSMTALIVKSVIEGEIRIVDYSKTEKLTYEINQIGKNINQIAHKVNAEGFYTEQDFKNLRKEINKMWMQIDKICAEEDSQ